MAGKVATMVQAVRYGGRLALAGAALMLATAATAADTAPADEAYPCLMEPWQVLKLAAPVQGLVASVDVDRGDRVKRGQIVARLEAEVEAANVDLAQVHASDDSQIQQVRAKLAFLRRKAERNEKLRASATVSLAQFEEAESDARVAEAQLHEAELANATAKLELKRARGLLRQRDIVSPIDGIVTERTLGPGEFRHEQATVVTVAQIDPLRVEAFLPIAAWPRLAVGGQAEVMPEAPIGGTYKATITVVDRVFDAASGTVGVRLSLPNPGGTLPAGLHCRLRLLEPKLPG
ncbi:MAG: efflux RND transporter periplasmic adaptor subunit [Proteobacteria bacterium]|nr:efflux RND transporter periplasmic adaptor subunit [Pseudomonadota bacterium]